MPTPLSEQFFTLTSLGTMAGATAATFVVTNTLKIAFDVAPKWLGLIIAQIVCIGLALASQVEGSDYIIAILNGCLVYLSAAGASGVGAPISKTAAKKRVGAREKGNQHEGAEMGDHPPQTFFSSWF